MNRVARIISAFIIIYYLDEASGKNNQKKMDSQLLAEGAKGIKFFEAGRFQEALAVFSG
jgi:hypothetical protein